jgi:hypothetical protein
MSEQIKLDGSIFGYDMLIKEGGEFVALQGEGKPTLYKGMSVVLVGDTQGYVPSDFKPEEEVIIGGFREAFKSGNSDHIVLVSNATREGWVKPSNIQK